MMHAFAAEAFLLRKRPAAYVVGTIWVTLVMAFGFGIPYIVYRTLGAEHVDQRQKLLQLLLPSSVNTTAASSYPMFGGAVLLILGVLLTGSEYGWGTWKVRLTQGPTRVAVLTSKIAAGALAAVAISLGALLASCGIAFGIGQVEGVASNWPPITALLASFGSTALISVTWMSVGAALGVIFRGTSVALVVGLLWTLAFENAVSALTGIVSGLEPLRGFLLSSASGSLVASLGARTASDGGTPGVVNYLSAPASVVVLVAYIFGSVIIATLLIRHRDIA